MVEWLETYSTGAFASIIAETLEPIPVQVPDVARNCALPILAMKTDKKREPELETEETQLQDEFDLELYIRHEVSNLFLLEKIINNFAGLKVFATP